MAVVSSDASDTDMNAFLDDHERSQDRRRSNLVATAMKVGALVGVGCLVVGVNGGSSKAKAFLGLTTRPSAVVSSMDQLIQENEEDLPRFPLRSCFSSKSRYDPMDMPSHGRSYETSVIHCQERCKRTNGCAYISFWNNGGCHLAESSAQMVPAEADALSGPSSCTEDVCFDNGHKYTPLNMDGHGRSEEGSALECHARCRRVSGCKYFSWWPDGGCHIHGENAMIQAADWEVVTGPADCPLATTTSTERPITTTAKTTTTAARTTTTERSTTTLEETTTIDPPTTEEGTTQAPTSEAPTTEEGTTQAPSTEKSTTQAPTSEAPTTEVSTTEAPNTEESTTTEESTLTEESTTTEEITTIEASTTEEVDPISPAEGNRTAMEEDNVTEESSNATVQDEMIDNNTKASSYTAPPSADAQGPCKLGVELLVTSHRQEQLEEQGGQPQIGTFDAPSKQWVLHDAGDGYFFITGHNNLRLLNNEGSITMEEGVGSEQEKWKVTDAGLGAVFIRSHSGDFLQDFEGSLKLTENSDAWEKWTITASSSGENACTFEATKLFCVSVMRSWDDDLSLLKRQSEEQVGIFGCDEMLVIADKEIALSSTTRTVAIAQEILDSNRGGQVKNKDLFLDVWEEIKLDGRYKQADWVVKVDPDAVLLPARLRERLGGKSHAQTRSTFYANCAAKVDVQAEEHPHFMYGALEIMSLAAVESYFDGAERCKQEVGLGEQMWEERYMTHCLELLGAHMNTHLSLNLLADSHCDNVEGAPDCTSGAAAFHKMSTPDEYMECLSTAEGKETMTFKQK